MFQNIEMAGFVYSILSYQGKGPFLHQFLLLLAEETIGNNCQN